MAYEYESFKADFFEMTGIDLNMYKERQMKRRIESLIARKGFDGFESFHKGMEQNEELLRTFVRYLTINVSQFYRNPAQWETFENEVLPYLCERFHDKITIWSAACSTGDEPYTLAMICAKHIPLQNIRIIATDIDEDVLKFAAKGKYSAKSLVNLPTELKEKWFTPVEKNRYAVDERLKECISFKKHNLLADPYYEHVQLIVCRNVVIYFTDKAKTNVYRRFHDCMDSHGVLFIGSTEQILRPKEYGFENFVTFFYKKI